MINDSENFDVAEALPPAKRIGPMKLAFLGVSNFSLSQNQREFAGFWLDRWRPETIIQLPYTAADKGFAEVATAKGYEVTLFNCVGDDEFDLAVNVADLIYAADVILIASPGMSRLEPDSITMRSLVRYDKDYIHCTPDGYQHCSSNPYEWVIPREGPSMQARLQQLLNRRTGRDNVAEAAKNLSQTYLT
jgi:hypothetical protein